MLADSGYYSEDAASEVEANGGPQVYAAVAKRKHGRRVEELEQRPDPPPPPAEASITERIREIVAVAHEVAALGQPITWENIGDPVAKGEVPPRWIRDVVSDLVHQPESWGYCDTQGVPRVRAFLADEVNAREGVQVTADDILFFNAYYEWRMAKDEDNPTGVKIAFGRLKVLRSSLERRFPEVEAFDDFVERGRRHA